MDGECDRFDNGRIMVYDEICSGYKTRLVTMEVNLTSQRYIDVLQRIVFSFVCQYNLCLHLELPSVMSRELQWTIFAKPMLRRSFGSHTVPTSHHHSMCGAC